MAIAQQAPLPARRTGRRIASETPHQIIEGEAYEAATELVYYRDTDQVRRIRADAGCDDAVRRMERAHEMGDDVAFRAATDDYWTSDRDEDGAAENGDGRVFVAHAHLRVIPAMCVEIEMGACPTTASERGLTSKSSRPAGRTGAEQ